MNWLRRHAWWGLLLMTVVLLVFGVTDLFIGSASDPGIPLGLIGLSPDELRAQREAGYQILDFFTRSQGLALIVLGLFGTAILVFAYRRDQPWAWWAMWSLPAWSASVFLLYIVSGVDASQPPPPPMVSGSIFAVFTAAIQLVSLPRFFGSRAGTG